MEGRRSDAPGSVDPDRRGVRHLGPAGNPSAVLQHGRGAAEGHAADEHEQDRAAHRRPGAAGQCRACRAGHGPGPAGQVYGGHGYLVHHQAVRVGEEVAHQPLRLR